MTVDEYLIGIPEPQRTTLTHLREVLRELLPDAEEALSYSMPAFKVDGKAVAGYGASKNHCSYYPHTGSILPDLVDALGDYDWSPGALRFPVDEDLPRSLVELLVEARLDQLGRR
jgi:uncharacterized protein YdhG (YjbR/CyaY superfamily)